jgi:hypothetical protein
MKLTNKISLALSTALVGASVYMASVTTQVEVTAPVSPAVASEVKSLSLEENSTLSFEENSTLSFEENSTLSGENF